MMKKQMHGLITMLTLAMALVLSAPAFAGGYGGHHSRGHHGYGGHHNSYGHYYTRHHYGGHHGYGYLAAGLVLGAAYSNYSYQPRYVERRTIVYRRPVQVQRTVYVPATAAASQAAPVSTERPDYYLRKDREGECWLVESTEDGEQIITPQSPDVCG